jgi:hypothetical protein
MDGRGSLSTTGTSFVVPTATGDKQLFVDPTLYDAGMGWDIAASVTSDVRAP